MIKTFRGLLADGGQDRIRLSTKKGKIGYKIINFQIMGQEPGEGAMDHTMKIFKVQQSSVNNTIDFSDGNLLGMAYLQDDAGAHYPASVQVIFEQEIFNQDIFITHVDTNAALPCSYYLELETSSLTDNAAAVSTLRDIRLNPQVGG